MIGETEFPKNMPAELKVLAHALLQLGYAVRECEIGASFGNYAVTFASPERRFAVVRDRGQYQVDYEDQAELQRAGLWRSYSGINSLSKPLFAWLSAQNAA